MEVSTCLESGTTLDYVDPFPKKIAYASIASTIVTILIDDKFIYYQY